MPLLFCGLRIRCQRCTDHQHSIGRSRYIPHCGQRTAFCSERADDNGSAASHPDDDGAGSDQRAGPFISPPGATSGSLSVKITDSAAVNTISASQTPATRRNRRPPCPSIPSCPRGRPATVVITGLPGGTSSTEHPQPGAVFRLDSRVEDLLYPATHPESGSRIRKRWTCSGPVTGFSVSID